MYLPLPRLSAVTGPLWSRNLCSIITSKRSMDRVSSACKLKTLSSSPDNTWSPVQCSIRSLYRRMSGIAVTLPGSARPNWFRKYKQICLQYWIVSSEYLHSRRHANISFSSVMILLWRDAFPRLRSNCFYEDASLRECYMSRWVVNNYRLYKEA